MLQTQEYVGLLIAAARRRLHQAVKSRVSRLRLSPPQFWVLLALQEKPGESFGDLSRRMRIDAPRASRLVASLSRRRLVTMAKRAGDRRSSKLVLTASGLALAGSLQPIASALRNALVEGLSLPEQEALRSSLRKVIGNLEKFERLPERAPTARKRHLA